jgi:prepilin-type N-terminal cleavage/methylation domain-containing protein
MTARRMGMTIVEVLIALAILAILAAVVLPTTAGQLRDGHATALANQLANLREAIGNYRQNVGAYPRFLTQLTTQPVAGDDDACAANLSNGELNAWRGPYLNQNVVGDLPVGNAIIVSLLTRVPAGTAALLQIRAARVESDIASQLELQFDGNANFATGSVLWTAAGDDTLTFQIPIRGC